ncbi:hypothetical protein RFI_19475, partial [Reticulomyxa filosa]
MAELDQTLMDEKHGFSVDQLMELAGIAVADAIVMQYGEAFKSEKSKAKPKALVLCGTGNNGGDGLVTARHLKHFHLFEPVVLYPKVPPKEKLFE